MKKTQHRILSAVLALVLVLSLVLGLSQMARREPDDPIRKTDEVLQVEAPGGGTSTAPTETTEPEDTEPETTEPSTEPPEETTAPTEPDATEPPADPSGPTSPDVTDPVVTDPTLPSTQDPTDPAGPTAPTGPGNETQPNVPDPTGPEKLSIDTDLTSRSIQEKDLPDGQLAFWVKAVGGTGREIIRVTLRNSATPFNGTTLTSTDGLHYQAQLRPAEYNTITVYVKLDGENVLVRTFRIYYTPNRADEENPAVGEYPPSIVLSTDGIYSDGDIITSENLLLTVTARTNPKGDPIYSNQIKVWLNGVLVEKQTGDARPEYQLHFERSNVSDYRDYKIEVMAWDGENSSYRSLTLRHHAIDEGDVKGSVTVELDCSVLHLNWGDAWLDREELEIRQGDTWAKIVLRFLEDCGYEATYDGTVNSNFYLRSIYRADFAAGAQPDEKLWALILRDGLTLNENQHDSDSLGEFDYTMASGWMYCINGGYPGRGMASTEPNDGDTLTLCFTLSYGKDIGGYESSGGSYGHLSSYCGMWRRGSYIPLEHDFQVTERVEPTATEDGYILSVCSRCLEEKKEILPATGETEPTDPAPTEPIPTEPEPTEPEPTDPVPTDPEPSEPVDPTSLRRKRREESL